MAKNYVYRMDHDTGFAPNVDGGVCSLCGCMTTTIEKWARKGSWVIGIGGDGTTKSDMLIYMMEVDDILSRSEFQDKYSRKSTYLKNTTPDAGRVLIARTFYYLGKRAIALPDNLKHVVAHMRERKLVRDEDICAFLRVLSEQGFTVGVSGKPNNPETPCTACGPLAPPSIKTRTSVKCPKHSACRNRKSAKQKEVRK